MAFSKSEQLGNERETQRAHPWLRFWARSLDLHIYSAPLSLAMLGCSVLQQTKPDSLESVVAILLSITGTILFYVGGWVLIESFLLALVGTTPAKCFFRIRIHTTEGSRLSFLQALKRTLKVWIMGTGFLIPLVSHVTMIVQYSILKRQGSTPWDREENLVVTHQPISPLRLALVIIIIMSMRILDLSLEHSIPEASPTFNNQQST